MVATIAERKAERVARLERSVASAMQRLATYAAAHAGRFVVFGSAARGDMHYDSDFDIIVDFPSADERQARAFAEATSHALGLRPDLVLIADASPALMERVERDAVILK